MKKQNRDGKLLYKENSDLEPFRYWEMWPIVRHFEESGMKKMEWARKMGMNHDRLTMMQKIIAAKDFEGRVQVNSATMIQLLSSLGMTRSELRLRGDVFRQEYGNLSKSSPLPVVSEKDDEAVVHFQEEDLAVFSEICDQLNITNGLLRELISLLNKKEGAFSSFTLHQPLGT